MERIKSHYNTVAVILFIVFVITAHFLAPGKYDFAKNTIGDLGSQGYDYKAVMQTGFILFGLVLIMGISLNEINLRTTPLLVYSFCILLTGVFCAKPSLTATPFSSSEMQSILHPLFTQAAGIAFCIGILVQVFYTAGKKKKLVHVLFFILAVCLTVAFFLRPDNPGIIQRVLYAVNLFWLALFYEP